jgi:hypothetical protein
MGILDSMPQGLVIFLTWFVYWAAACALILILSIAMSKLLGDIVDGLLGWIR